MRGQVWRHSAGEEEGPGPKSQHADAERRTPAGLMLQRSGPGLTPDKAELSPARQASSLGSHPSLGDMEVQAPGTSPIPSQWVRPPSPILKSCGSAGPVRSATSRTDFCNLETAALWPVHTAPSSTDILTAVPGLACENTRLGPLASLLPLTPTV